MATTDRVRAWIARQRPDWIYTLEACAWQQQQIEQQQIELEHRWP